MKILEAIQEACRRCGFPEDKIEAQSRFSAEMMGMEPAVTELIITESDAQKLIDAMVDVHRQTKNN